MYGVTTPLSSFTALIARHVPHCLELLKEREVLWAAADFCKSTRSWRASIEGQAISAGDKWIDANRLAKRIYPHAMCYAVDDIMLGDTKFPLVRLSIDDMDRNRPGWLSHTGGAPTGFMLYEDRRIRLYPAMNSDAESVYADIEMVLIPGPTAALLPDFLFHFHQDAIIHMAVFRLFTQVGMPWYNADLAQFHFAAAVSEMEKGKAEQAKRAVDALNERSRARFY